MKLLDCTLRDGGYYTSWDFSRQLVARYLNAMAASNIDIVELGLRNYPSEQFLGAHAYTTDDFINSLNVPEKLEIAVMVDAKTILSHPGSCNEAIASLFVERNQSPVSVVRIAAHFTEVNKCEEITAVFKRLGYTVGLNLMQSGGRTDGELTQVAAEISSWGTVDVLYFADSLGNMDAKEVTRIYEAIRSSWKGMIGIHTHNNQGKALENSITAYDVGAEWIDSTVLGMGRGAGNSASELLTLELEKKGEQYQSKPIWKLVLDDFQPLQITHGWGASLLYHFAAENNIHPTYVQNLLGDKRYTSEQIIQALSYIAPLKASSYSSALLSEGLSGRISSENGEGVKGSWDATEWCVGKELIVLGAGETVTEYRDAIESFIKKRDVFTLSLNIHNDLDEQLIDAYVAIDPMRLMLEINDYSHKAKPLFSSFSSLPQELAANLDKLHVRDYGVDVKSGKFEAHKNNCTIPSLLSLAYAFALAKQGGAKCLWLVGFDGYQAGDKRQEEMTNLLEVVKQSDFDLECICLTPSTYPIKQGSVYAPY